MFCRSLKHIDRVLLRPLAGAKYCNLFVTMNIMYIMYMYIASSRRQTTGSRSNLHTMVSRQFCVHDMLKVKVKVKGHVIRALLYWRENRFLRIIGIRGIIHYSRQVCNLLFLALQYSSPGGSTTAGEVCYLRLPCLIFY